MTSVDQRSIDSTSTLVPEDNDELHDQIRDLPQLIRSVGQDYDEEDEDLAIQQIAALRFQQLINNNTGPANREDVVSRQSSVTTLNAQPIVGNSTRATTARPLAPLASLSSPLPPPRVTKVPETDTQDGIRVPWWSTMLPSPNMSGRKSSGKTRVSSTSSASSSYDRSQASTSSSGHSTPVGTGSPLRRGSETSPSQTNTSSSASPIPPPLPSEYPLYAKCYCEENAYLLAAYLSRTCQQWNQHEISATKEMYMRWDVDVVVVSNKNKTVALWQQKAGMSPSDGHQVVWDYHVFVVVSCQKRFRSTQNVESIPSTSRQGRQLFSRSTSADTTSKSDETISSWIYDLDSRFASPTPLQMYLVATFCVDPGVIVHRRLQPLFRVISANDYFVRFGSDRSHMKVISTERGGATDWLQPRPEWDLIMGRKALHSNSYFMDSFVDMRVRIGDGRFGVIVKIDELIHGRGLMSGKEAYQEDILAAGVAVLLDRIGNASRSDSTSLPNYQEADSSQDANVMIPLEEDEVERTPGVVIGGVVRMGMRPPPPPPYGAVVATNRGKRIMDPLYPAYIMSAYEHRLEDHQDKSPTS
jgi:hypothetical protein